MSSWRIPRRTGLCLYLHMDFGYAPDKTFEMGEFSIMLTEGPASIMLGTVEDLPRIYADMEQQFPPDEMYKYKILLQLLHRDKYKILLYKRDSDGALLGYALVYTVENCNILWLDYIAVLKEHQSHGYGNQLFNALWHKYCGPCGLFDGILFSVEHVCGDHSDLAKRQERRITFYEHLGAYRLHAGFLLPCDSGSLPMYLYFKPRRGLYTISRTVQIQAIGQMYEYCFFYLKHRKDLLARFKQTILDEKLMPAHHPVTQDAAAPVARSVRHA